MRKLPAAGAALFIVSVSLAGCGDKLNRQISRLTWFLSWGKIGSSPDYLLVKNGLAGREPVGVIFGFVDDEGFCKEIADLYVKKHPLDSYHCEAAN